MLDKQIRIFVAGHTGMLGSAVVRCLSGCGYRNIVTVSSNELDLRRQADVETFFTQKKPDVVFLAAAKVGGIAANNTYRAEFIYENLAIETNVIHAAWQVGVKNLIFFSSSCAYPRKTTQPMKEDDLWTGKLEPTNEPYAVAKLAGMSMCSAYNQQYGTHYFPIVPTNLYGENDNYHPERSHVVSALIRKFHEAKVNREPVVTLWGTGTPRREFLYVDDAASAAIHLFENYPGDAPVNVGSGVDMSIAELAELIRSTVGYNGNVQYDSSKPDGAPRKLLDSSVIHQMGWSPSVSMAEGLRRAYQDFLASEYPSL